MHYLEDYLELLDPLPEIMREKLNLIRENDVKIQSELTQLEEDASQFLTNYRLYQQQTNLSPTRSKINTHRTTTTEPINSTEPQLTAEQSAAQKQKQAEYDRIVQRHQQLIKDSEAKINLANESHEIVDRYYKKLENDLNKFKMELEADYSGITETLERRFATEGFNEYDNNNGENSNFEPFSEMEPLLDPLDDITLSNSTNEDYANQSTLSFLMSSQFRRPPTGFSNSSLLNRKSGTQRLLSSSSRGRKRLQGISSANNIGKHRKRLGNRTSFLNDSFQSQSMHHSLPPSDSDESSSASNLQTSGHPTTNEFFPLQHQTSSPNLFDDDTNGGFDANTVLTNPFPGQTIDERRYCFCNEMSYGDMIACDNPNCRREWFHYPCVGIITPPKGKWFCSDCVAAQQQQQQQTPAQTLTTQPHTPTTKRVSTS